MTSEEKQAAYAASRQVITRPLRHVGQPAMEQPPTLSFRPDQEAAMRAWLVKAGMEFADEQPGDGSFW